MDQRKHSARTCLSDKQREVLDLVVARKSSKEIARILGISKPTVDQRISSARRRFGASSRNELVAQYLASSLTYDRVTYDPAYIPSTFERCDANADGSSGPVFSVEDVASQVLPHSQIEVALQPRPLETLDRKFGALGRVGAIGLVAALVAVSLLAMMSIAHTLTHMV